MEFSKKLQGKIDELKALKQSREASGEKMKGYNDSIAQELAETEQELATAIEQLGDDPSAENRKKENEARKKVAALRLEVSGSQQRSSVVFQSKSVKENELTLEVLRLAKAEILANHAAEKDKALERIAKAKQEYLEAAKAYHDLIMVDGQGKYYDLVREIGVNEKTAKDNEPSLSVHQPIYTYRGNGTNPYGIIDREIYSAWMQGEIK
ncbi:hypothetical protein [Bacillus gobiensis]|uniref:Uncharacterized protein n=1 Tax=Bacillus gobiensis TaxID=1441095 RepID=A0A0M4G8K3_9BACI|nr:hypothetical protein [Bacillus gobiensis]ALC81545.1 hypothetical protein AM592_07990 [Bacillus gobiensis]